MVAADAFDAPTRSPTSQRSPRQATPSISHFPDSYVDKTLRVQRRDYGLPALFAPLIQDTQSLPGAFHPLHRRHQDGGITGGNRRRCFACVFHRSPASTVSMWGSNPFPPVYVQQCARNTPHPVGGNPRNHAVYACTFDLSSFGSTPQSSRFGTRFLRPFAAKRLPYYLCALLASGDSTFSFFAK